MNEQFKSTTFWELLESTGVNIPKFQRDYAQGRTDSKSKEIRKEFVKNLYESMSKDDKKIQLDFIYGTHSKDNNYFEPLDGQQRLTTLFLLHTYIAKREDKLDDTVKNTLLKFKYETRQSSTDFIKHLITEHWEINPKPSDSIKNQFWYSLTWDQDPTVLGMLEMLDEIHSKYEGENLWNQLINSQKITFNLLEIKDFGLSQDLYIKMNSRGKPLTDFENLKAQLFDFFKQELSTDEVKRIETSFDNEWLDLFWEYAVDEKDPKKIGNLLDEKFKTFLDFISDLLYKSNKSKESDESNESKKSKESKNNLSLEKYRDVYSHSSNIGVIFGEDGIFAKLSNLKKEGIETLFNTIFTNERRNKNNPDKKIFLPQKDSQKDSQKYSLNLFAMLLNNKLDNTAKLLLFGILIKLTKIEFINNNLSDDDLQDFKKRVRILRNIIWNSTISLNAKEHLEFVQNLMLNDIKETLEKSTFPHAKEELQKFINEPKLDTELIFELENHLILTGSVKPFLDKTDYLSSDYVDVFYEWFSSENSEGDDLNELRIALLDIELDKKKSDSGDKIYKLCRTANEWKKSFKGKSDIYFTLMERCKEGKDFQAYLKELSEEKKLPPWIHDINSHPNSLKGIALIDFREKESNTRLLESFDYRSKFVGLYPRIFGYYYKENQIEGVKYKENLSRGNKDEFVYGSFECSEFPSDITLCFEYEYKDKDGQKHKYKKYSLWFEKKKWEENLLKNIISEDTEKKWFYRDSLEKNEVIELLKEIKTELKKNNSSPSS